MAISEIYYLVKDSVSKHRRLSVFELRLNFDCFLNMASKDHKSTCLRIIDAMLLEKIKQQKASNFAGLGMIPDSPTIADFEKSEKEIASRYSEDDLKKIRKYGFTGLPIEQRAILTGHDEAYNIVYRNFSRNIHSTDYVEHYMLQGYFDLEKMHDYHKSREIVTLYTAIFSTGGIAEFANLAFDCGFDAEIKAIGLRQEKLKNLNVT